MKILFIIRDLLSNLNTCLAVLKNGNAFRNASGNASEIASENALVATSENVSQNDFRVLKPFLL